MFGRLDRARWCVGVILCAAAMVWSAATPGRAQSLQQIFGFGRTDPGPPPSADVATTAETPPEAAPAPKKPAPRRAMQQQPAKSTTGRPSWEALKEGDAGGDRVNANTVTIMTGDLDTTYAALADDLSAVLDGDNLRILPVIGKGSAQNVRDVRFMKGVDLGIAQLNTLAHFKKTNQIGPIDDKIVYLAKLFNEEMHVIVRRDGNFATLADLNGQRVNFGEVGSGTQLTARDLFARLGISVTEVNLDQAHAVHELKDGRIVASVVISGKPVSLVSRLSTKDGFKLLPVPYAKSLRDDYMPSTLTAADYPELVEESVDTVAVGAVLFAYNWPKGSDRYRRIEKFVNAFFPRIGALQNPPRHPKWRETNLAAVVPGWQRFAGADDWLRKSRDQTIGSGELSAYSSSAGDAGDRAGAGPQQRERLFQEFLRWNRERHVQ